jgi:Tol biopolymer transport system component
LSALAFSTDGKSVSYTVVLNGAAHRYSDTISSGPVETEVAVISDGARRYVVSPDGKTKAFIDQRDGKINLYTVDADGKNEKALTSLGVVSNQWLPVWDASGRYLVFAVHKDGEDGIYVVALAGSAEPKKIADYYFDSTAPAF